MYQSLDPEEASDSESDAAPRQPPAKKRRSTGRAKTKAKSAPTAPQFDCMLCDLALLSEVPTDQQGARIEYITLIGFVHLVY